ncbi:C1 family peptidase [Methanotrichaceae archaeon M04Ac]|uniref:C1 family peptidase n=1 Tax=Candidatus Methanocrinis alkalitolerans TaxID=3033395 RepID=A0ABT5XGI7_9EURY|nr:C1 family peptidase [Candidatus Methanocrinis alkalitolerans]MDF0593838.1 C1 family peptidase [Candidatus Methanocrinis alkalitolerans]
MKDDVVAAGGDWDAIEALLDSLSLEDRELVIATYPERLAELEAVRRAIEETGANWTAGLNSVSILPPELRPGTGWLPLSAKEGGLFGEVVRISSSEDGPAALALPESWDWRSVSGADWTTPIKDQGQCGSCWAFGPLAAIESRVKLAADNPQLIPDFSEQYLVSCSPGSCSGGYMNTTADWILCQGTVDEACFPYVAQDTVPCSESCFDRNSRKYKGEGWSWVSGNSNIIDEDRIKQEILAGGPVTAAMEVYTDFYNYNGGVYQYTTGELEGGHCIAIVGWGKEGSTDYWICKNSWGTGWGEAGWFKIKMGEVNIGLEAVAYQPKVRGKVLFYEGHEPWEEFELLKRYSEWGNRLASNGYLVHSSATVPLSLDLLSCYDVVIISNPTTSFSVAELAAIKEFVKRGRVIAAGDGDLFDSYYIYRQENEKVAVQYVDWLATGDGGGLMVMGERSVSNAAANQVGSLFGLKINSDTIYDPMRYETEPGWPVLGPKENVLVLASASLAISKDAFPLARATSSGYVATAAATYETADASGESFRAEFAGGLANEGADPIIDLIPPELDSQAAAGELEPPTISIEDLPAGENGSYGSGAEHPGYEILPEDMPPVGKVLPEGELTAPDEKVEVAFSPVPLAGLAFAGPIGIAAVDFGRKGEDTAGFWRSSTRTWYFNYDNAGTSDYSFYWAGQSTDIPLVGDWNGDGKDTAGFWRPSTQTWYFNYDNAGTSEYSFYWAGQSTDIPLVGDWNGDGKDTAGFWRPSTRTWYFNYDNAGTSEYSFVWDECKSTDIPLVGDWNGDGKDTAGFWRPSTRTWYFNYDNAGTSEYSFYWAGQSTDIPLVGDWNGDGKDTAGFWRPSTRTWYFNYDNAGTSEYSFVWDECKSTDIPLVGDWYKPN